MRLKIGQYLLFGHPGLAQDLLHAIDHTIIHRFLEFIRYSYFLCWKSKTGTYHSNTLPLTPTHPA